MGGFAEQNNPFGEQNWPFAESNGGNACTLTIDLVNAEGEALAGVSFTLSLTDYPVALYGKIVDPAPLRLVTDAAGHAQVLLSAGIEVLVRSAVLPGGVSVATEGLSSVALGDLLGAQGSASTCTVSASLQTMEAAAKGGVLFKVQPVEPSGVAGKIVAPRPVTKTTDAEGAVSFTLFQGLEHRVSAKPLRGTLFFDTGANAALDLADLL